MARGGYHSHAERWGRKSAWRNDSVTKTIRVPESLASQVLDLAHKLDDGETIAFETESNQVLKDETSRLKDELEQARLDCARLRQELVVCQAKSQKQPLDLEAIRDRFLASLRLGKQAPEYKRTKKILDSFIAFDRPE